MVFLFVNCDALILDYITDGQLGVSGENSATPCMLKQFLELGSPQSLADESQAERKRPLKVRKISLFSP